MNYSFRGESAEDVWRDAATMLLMSSAVSKQDSQRGPTREVLHATFYINNPIQRWVLSRQPGINPAFAIAELFWILAGRNDLRSLRYWNSVYSKYAGSEDRLHGAYGYRLRRHFGNDQLERALTALQSNPDSRQIVLSMWDFQADFPNVDGSPVSKDVPCNVCSLLKVRGGRLEWMQVMRSNDLFLGTPYNFIQFTTLQEVMAGWLGLEVGSYYHLSDSLHVYTIYDGESDKFSISRDPPCVANKDQLGLRKADFDIALEKVIQVLDALTDSALSIEKFRELCAFDDFPVGYRNLLLIPAADSARRRGWNVEVDKALSQCTNEVLVSAWHNWRSQYRSRKLR